MKIAVGADHAGFPLKETVLQAVLASGNEPLDLGTTSTAPVDYPDFAEKVGRSIQSGESERGILICGSGIGACMAANKLRGVYASIAHDTYSAAQGVEHDNMNVLCLGGRVIGPETVKAVVEAFLQARYSGEERHARRLQKLQRIESESMSGKSGGGIRNESH